MIEVILMAAVFCAGMMAGGVVTILGMALANAASRDAEHGECDLEDEG